MELNKKQLVVPFETTPGHPTGCVTIIPELFGPCSFGAPVRDINISMGGDEEQFLFPVGTIAEAGKTYQVILNRATHSARLIETDQPLVEPRRSSGFLQPPIDFVIVDDASGAPPAPPSCFDCAAQDLAQFFTAKALGYTVCPGCFDKRQAAGRAKEVAPPEG